MTLISVIIPTYEKHHKYLPEAIASVDFEQSEIIVVNDSLTHIPLEQYPDVVLIQREDEEPWGTGRARNEGAKVAKGESLLWLDSDDIMIPGAIQLLWDAYVKSKTSNNPDGNIIYGDLIRSDNNYYWKVHDQYCGPDIRKSGLITSNRPYCCLISKTNHDSIGGYDENLPTYEDVDYEKKTTVAGMCETHLNAAIYWYRWKSGGRRDLGKDPAIEAAVNDYMYNKYKDYHTGAKKLANCRKCGDQPINPYRTNQVNNRQPKVLPMPETDEVQWLVYIGGDPTHSKDGPVTDIGYRFGADRRHSRKKIVNHLDVSANEVNRDDAREFLKLRIHNRDQFKYETEIIITDRPNVKSPKIEPKQKVVQIKPLPEMNTIFEQDSIVSYTIKNIEDKLEEEDVPRSQLQLWLEEELGRGDDARIGMQRALRAAIG